MNIYLGILTAALVIGTACSHADERTAHASSPRAGSAHDGASDPTAFNQSDARADLDHLTEIRQALVADDSLSTSAKNVEVLTRDGNVLLRGQVASVSERDAVERHVRACAATRSIDDRLEIEAH